MLGTVKRISARAVSFERGRHRPPPPADDLPPIADPPATAPPMDDAPTRKLLARRVSFERGKEESEPKGGRRVDRVVSFDRKLVRDVATDEPKSARLTRAVSFDRNHALERQDQATADGDAVALLLPRKRVADLMPLPPGLPPGCPELPSPLPSPITPSKSDEEPAPAPAPAPAPEPPPPVAPPELQTPEDGIDTGPRNESEESLESAA